MAVQVHGDVGLARFQQCRDFRVAFAAHIFEMVEGPPDACAHRAPVVRPEGNAGDLEAAAVMALEQFGQELCRGMLVEVGGKIGQPDPVMAVSRSHGRLCVRRNGAADIILGTTALKRGVVAITQQNKGLND